MSKRRRGFPSEAKVKRGGRSIKGGEIELQESSATTTPAHPVPAAAFKNCCRNDGCF